MNPAAPVTRMALDFATAKVDFFAMLTALTAFYKKFAVRNPIYVLQFKPNTDSAAQRLPDGLETKTSINRNLALCDGDYLHRVFEF